MNEIDPEQTLDDLLYLVNNYPRLFNVLKELKKDNYDAKTIKNTYNLLQGIRRRKRNRA